MTSSTSVDQWTAVEGNKIQHSKLLTSFSSTLSGFRQVRRQHANKLLYNLLLIAMFLVSWTKATSSTLQHAAKLCCVMIYHTPGQSSIAKHMHVISVRQDSRVQQVVTPNSYHYTAALQTIVCRIFLANVVFIWMLFNSQLQYIITTYWAWVPYSWSTTSKYTWPCI